MSILTTPAVTPAAVREALERSRARFAASSGSLAIALIRTTRDDYRLYRSCKRALEEALPSAWTSVHAYAEWAEREDVLKRFDLAIANLEGGQP